MKNNTIMLLKHKLTTKRLTIVLSIIILQIIFGFDPKFTLINLIWLIF